MQIPRLIVRPIAALTDWLGDRVSIRIRLDGLDFGERDVAPEFGVPEPPLQAVQLERPAAATTTTTRAQAAASLG